MPIMPDDQRKIIVEEILSKNRASEIDSLTFEEMLAFVGAIDDWVVANQSDFNASLPQPARGALTARQKAWAFNLVVRRRWLVNA